MAAQNAIANPLLDEISLKGAKAVLVNVTGGLDMTLLEVDEAANAISAEVDADANIIFGAAFDPSLDGKIRVSVVATGMEGSSMSAREQAPVKVAGAAPRRLGEAGLTRAPEPTVHMTPVAAMQEPELFDEPAAKAAEEAHFLRDARAEPASITAVQPDLIDEDLVRSAPPRSYADDDEPLFPEVHGDRRQHKGGWLSLFGGGRQRYDAPTAAPQAAIVREAPQRPVAGPTPQVRTTASAQLAEEPRGDEGEDLNIPSFLRRLAN